MIQTICVCDKCGELAAPSDYIEVNCTSTFGRYVNQRAYLCESCYRDIVHDVFDKFNARFINFTTDEILYPVEETPVEELPADEGMADEMEMPEVEEDE